MLCYCLLRRTPQANSNFRHPFPQRLAQPFLLITQWSLIIIPRKVTRAIGCATTSGVDQIRFGIGQASDEHTVVQQGDHHTQQGAFLSTVQTGGGGEHGGGFTCECAGEPDVGGGVDEIFQWCSHVAEAGGAAEDQAAAFVQVVVVDVGRAVGGNVVSSGFAEGGYGRHGAQPCAPGVSSMPRAMRVAISAVLPLRL